MSDVEERVKKIIMDHFDVEEDKVTDGTKIIEDLEADSLDRVELMMAFEEEFDTEIPEGPADLVVTVQDAIDLVGKYTNAIN